MKVFMVMAFFLPALANANQVTIKGAVGFFYSKQISYNRVINLCKVDFPGLETKISESLATWAVSNNRILSFTDEMMTQAKNEVPHMVNNITNAGLAAVNKVYEIMPQNRKVDYCNHYIEKLSSGEWDFNVYKPDYFKAVDRYLRSRQ